MKNILGETPHRKLSGRLLYSVKLVPDSVIANKRVLDIGCGYGWCELNFLSRGAKEIIATELTSSDLVTAQKYIKNPRVKYRTANAVSLPFPDLSFDTVVSWEVLEHIPANSETQMFSEIFRILKPGGNFFLSTPQKNLLSCILDPAWWIVRHRHYSPGRLRQFAGSAGFTIRSLEAKGKLWELLGTLDMYISKWVFRRPPFFADYIEKCQDREYRSPGYAGLFMHICKNNAKK